MPGLSDLQRVCFNVDFFQFVEKVLVEVPNMEDMWQIEKWEAFRQISRGLAAFDTDRLRRMEALVEGEIFDA